MVHPGKVFPQTFKRPDGKMDRSKTRTDRMVRVKDMLSRPDELLGILREWVLNGRGISIWCRTNDVPYTTIRDWLAQDEKRQKVIDVARAESAHALVDSGLKLLQEARQDERLNDPRAANAWVALVRAESDYMRWQASRYLRPVYGDDPGAGGTGGGGGVVINVNRGMDEPLHISAGGQQLTIGTAAPEILTIPAIEGDYSSDEIEEEECLIRKNK